MTLEKGELGGLLGRRDLLALSFGAMVGWSWVVLAREMIERAGTVGSALAFVADAVVKMAKVMCRASPAPSQFCISETERRPQWACEHSTGFGCFLLALVVVGWILVARRGKSFLVLWGAFPLFFFVLISYTFFAGRYLNPIAPSLVVAGALSVGAIHNRWGKRVSIPVALVSCLQPLYQDTQIDRLFSAEDTRTVARRWILEHVPDGSAIALRSYTVPLPQSIGSIGESLSANDALDELERRGKFAHLADIAERENPTYRLYFLGKGDEKNRICHEYRDVIDDEFASLRLKGVRYWVLRHPPDTPPTEVAALFEQAA